MSEPTVVLLFVTMKKLKNEQQQLDYRLLTPCGEDSAIGLKVRLTFLLLSAEKGIYCSFLNLNGYFVHHIFICHCDLRASLAPQAGQVSIERVRWKKKEKHTMT